MHADNRNLAASITRQASKQTYYTIRLLVDRDLTADAYRAYAYFRWVDDILDAQAGSPAAKIAFIDRQKSLLETCYRRETLADLSAEESMLAELVRNDRGTHSGLQAYLRNMMAVMTFDAGRRGRLISQDELSAYSAALATAVTEAMHYFIGHNCPSPRNESRYLAVTAAHITHMLRDALEDADAGYYNIPGEFLQTNGITPGAIGSRAYRKWVRSRVQLARAYFKAGRGYLSRVKNLRCRMAGLAYTARFEWLLSAIERDGYHLRATYPQRKSLRAGLWMAWNTLKSAFSLGGVRLSRPELIILPVRSRDL